MRLPFARGNMIGVMVDSRPGYQEAPGLRLVLDIGRGEIRRTAQYLGHHPEDIVSNEDCVQAALSRRIGDQTVRYRIARGNWTPPRRLDIGFVDTDCQPWRVLGFVLAQVIAGCACPP